MNPGGADPDALVDARAAEEWWGIKADTIRWWRRSGLIAAKGKDSAGRMLYRWGDLLEAEYQARKSGRGRPRSEAA